MFGFPPFENKSDPIATRAVFFRRLGRNFLVMCGFIAFSLTVGTLGYHYVGGVEWVDGLLNAAMILTGMGPVDPMKTTAGKLFATFYALYSGIAFLTMIAVLVAPIYHRMLHRLHLETEDDKDGDDEKPK
ncbi:hypothetical protein [Limnoglobus roseus]|uniref:Two pore domain potassium channel family protein n=1 Tax=Limnoglobus roseus TaxID=2598579 RepID=A0A5C1ABZ6_9BACT|nr:hypothetical protein [Limnoglobus roseus]QEL15703.1 hypothetical protein PX52LOC_02638 [Limnoglobus roseus]